MSWIGHGIDSNFEDDRVSWIGGVVMNLEILLEIFALENDHKILNLAVHKKDIFIECIIENIKIHFAFKYENNEWSIRYLLHSCSLFEWINQYKELIESELDKIKSILNQQGGQSCC